MDGIKIIMKISILPWCYKKGFLSKYCSGKKLSLSWKLSSRLFLGSIGSKLFFRWEVKTTWMVYNFEEMLLQSYERYSDFDSARCTQQTRSSTADPTIPNFLKFGMLRVYTKKIILTERIFLLPVFNFRFFNASFLTLPVMIIGFIV